MKTFPFLAALLLGSALAATAQTAPTPATTTPPGTSTGVRRSASIESLSGQQGTQVGNQGENMDGPPGLPRKSRKMKQGGTKAKVKTQGKSTM